MLPFFVNYSYNPVIEELCTKESLVINAVKNAKRLRRLYKQLKKDVEFINLIVGYYYNKRHEDVPLQKKRDKVYLRRKNIQTKQLSMKLDYIKLRLFKVKKKLLPVIFKLELPKNFKIYLVFYAVLLVIAPVQILVQMIL